MLSNQGRIDVANLVRKDGFRISDTPAGQPPIVLARLPNVGAPPRVTATTTTRVDMPRSEPAVAPAPEPLPQPEPMPRLDLRTEISQRTHLRTDEAQDHSVERLRHFVDRGQRAASETAKTAKSAATSFTPEKSSKVEDYQPSPTNAKPQSLSEKLYQLHAQLAPLAGVIVALALIASAGLLYWLMVGPTQIPAPQFDQQSPLMNQEGLGSTFNQMPEGYVPAFVAQTPQIEQQVDNDDQLWAEVPLPAPVAPKNDVPPPLVEPRSEPITSTASPSTHELPVIREVPIPLELPVKGELLFPTTDTPDALDFGKLGTSPLNAPQSLPSVAQRPIENNQR